MLHVDAQKITSRITRPIRSQIMKVVEFEVYKEKQKNETSLTNIYYGASKPLGKILNFQNSKDSSSGIDMANLERVLKKARDLSW